MQKQISDTTIQSASQSTPGGLSAPLEKAAPLPVALPQNTLPATEDTATRLQQEIAAYRQADRKDTQRFWLMIGLMYGINSILSNQHLHLPTNAYFLFLPLPLLYLCFLLRILSGRSKRKVRRLILQMTQQADAGSIGPLLDAFSFNSRKTREATIDTLTSLLPHLTSDDSELLTTARRSVLRSHLRLATDDLLSKDVQTFFRARDRRTTDFYIAILQAFEKVGGPDELTVVQQTASLTPANSDESRIREAAAACLIALQPRVEALLSSTTLLRAADAAAAGVETLLRVPTEGLPGASEELLRGACKTPE